MKINIALISHGQKPDMVSFVARNHEFLDDATIYATGTTGSKIEQEGYTVIKLLSGHTWRGCSNRLSSGYKKN